MSDSSLKQYGLIPNRTFETREDAVMFLPEAVSQLKEEMTALGYQVVKSKHFYDCPGCTVHVYDGIRGLVQYADGGWQMRVDALYEPVNA